MPADSTDTLAFVMAFPVSARRSQRGTTHDGSISSPIFLSGFMIATVSRTLKELLPELLRRSGGHCPLT